MSDLVEFLYARLRDDERVARSVPGPSWERRQITSTFDESEVFEDYVAVADTERNRVVLSDVDAEVLPFVLRHDPARVLRDVEAKRRIVTSFAALDEMPQRHTDAALHLQWNVLRQIVEILAEAHNQHPDYRVEWRVGA